MRSLVLLTRYMRKGLIYQMGGRDVMLWTDEQYCPCALA